MTTSASSFAYLQPGDTAIRLLAGRIPTEITIKTVTDDLIISDCGWEFDRTTGFEIDEELGFTPATGVIASFLSHRR